MASAPEERKSPDYDEDYDEFSYIYHDTTDAVKQEAKHRGKLQPGIRFICLPHYEDYPAKNQTRGTSRISMNIENLVDRKIFDHPELYIIHEPRKGKNKHVEFGLREKNQEDGSTYRPDESDKEQKKQEDGSTYGSDDESDEEDKKYIVDMKPNRYLRRSNSGTWRVAPISVARVSIVVEKEIELNYKNHKWM